MVKEDNPLINADLSRKAINRAVSSQVFQSPLTLFSLIGGVLGLCTGFLFSSSVFIYVGVGLLAFGLFGKLFNYFFRRGALESSYIREIQEKQEEYLSKLPERLSVAFTEHGHENGLKQLNELEKSFIDFDNLLDRKFSSKGLTLGRFHASANQVRMSALAKLEIISDLLKSIESIPEDLASDDQEISEAKKARINHRSDALKDIEQYHHDIENCLTSISEISVEVARIGTNSDSDILFETQLESLDRLAKRASQFKKERWKLWKLTKQK